MIYTGKMNAALFIVFLTRLLAGAAKEVFLIVDHLSVHEAAAVEGWLADKADRIEVFSLPKSAPGRNPDEYLNCDVKANINTNGLPKDREELRGNLGASRLQVFWRVGIPFALPGSIVGFLFCFIFFLSSMMNKVYCLLFLHL